MRVYPWDACLGASTSYEPPTRVQRRPRWDGAPSQAVESVQRSSVEISGEVVRDGAPDFDIMMDRLRGGVHLVAIWDFELRAQNGWDLEPALDSNGNEFWRANGKTAAYNGEAANPPTGPWRSVFAAANGGASAEATSLAVDGLLDGEVIPKGGWIRVGDFRHRVASAVTANASGEATLTLASPLREAVADNTQVRIPGDLFVGWLEGRPEISQADVHGLRTFSLRLVEAYEDEITDDSVSPTVGFEWVVP